MNLNVNTLLLSVLLTSSMYSMEKKKIELDETPADIYKEVLQMIPECKNQCSFLKSMLSKEKCREKCENNYLQQYEYYLVKKYTHLCARKPFPKEWRYKTEAQERGDDRKTCEERIWWQDDTIRSCVQNCLTQHAKNTQIFMYHFGMTTDLEASDNSNVDD